MKVGNYLFFNCKKEKLPIFLCKCRVSKQNVARRKGIYSGTVAKYSYFVTSHLWF